MNEKVLQTLEFDKVLQRVAAFTAFSVGREAVLALTPSSDLEQVKLRQQLTAEAARLMELQPSAAVTGAHDTIEVQARGEKPGRGRNPHRFSATLRARPARDDIEDLAGAGVEAPVIEVRRVELGRETRRHDDKQRNDYR